MLSEKGQLQSTVYKMTLILELCLCRKNSRGSTPKRPALLSPPQPGLGPSSVPLLAQAWAREAVPDPLSLSTHVLEHLNFYVECQWFCASPEFTAPSAEGTPFPLRTAPPYTLEVAAPASRAGHDQPGPSHLLGHRVCFCKKHEPQSANH